MGGGHSKFDQTNWFKANGRLESNADTINGADPTPTYRTYWITKRPGRSKYYLVVNQREFDVVDGERNLLYSTLAVPGTLLCFDVLGPGLDQYQLRVASDLARRHWTVYRYGIPTFPNQAHDPDATLQLTQEHSPDGIRRFPSGTAPKLYKVCGITVSWSRYAAVAVRFGPPPSPPAIPPSVTTTMENTEDDVNTKDDGITEHDDDTTQQPQQDTSNDLEIPHAPTDEQIMDPTSPSTTTTTIEPSNQVVDAGVDTTDTTAAAAVVVEAPDLVTEAATPPTPESITPTTSNTSPLRERIAETISTTTSIESCIETDHVEELNTTTTTKNNTNPKSLEMFLEMENSSHHNRGGGGGEDGGGGDESRKRVESTDNSVHSSGSKGSSAAKGGTSLKNSIHSVLAASSSLRATQQLPAWIMSKAKTSSTTTTTSTSAAAAAAATSTTTSSSSSSSLYDPMQGVLQMETPLLQCQEIFTHLIGTHQTMLISKEQVVQMLKDDAAKERQAKQHSKRGKKHFADAALTEQDNVEVSLEDAQALFTGGPYTAGGGGALSAPARGGDGGGGFTESADQNEEHHQDDDLTPPANDGQRNDQLQQQVESKEVSTKDLRDNEEGEDQARTAASAGTTTVGDVDDVATSTPTDVEDKDDADGAAAGAEAEQVWDGPLPGTDENEEQPLVGYWIWENSLYNHKMKMHLAKNSDLALHVVLAVIVNQVRYERNAIALTI